MPLFLLDGLKQLLSNGLIHVINLFVSTLLGSMKGGDECGLYYSAVVVDVTLGTLICYGLLSTFDKVVSYQNSKVHLFYAEIEKRKLFQEGG